MYKIVLFIGLVFLPICIHGQSEKIGSSYLSEECDTINLDENYITIDGERIATDSNVKEVFSGVFTIESVRFLSEFYCMLYISKKDTIPIIYDSVSSNNTLVYLIDTVYSVCNYNVLVSDEEVLEKYQYLHSVIEAIDHSQYYDYLIESGDDIVESLREKGMANSEARALYQEYLKLEEKIQPDVSTILDTTFQLHLRRFYNEMSLPPKKGNAQSNTAITVSCEQCQVILLNGKLETVYSCPLNNNLFKLE